MARDDGVEGLLFRFFNEIGIIEQLSRTLFEGELPDGLILPHFTVLNHLIRVQDGSTPLKLARAFQVPKTSMTHTLAVLEKHGLIEMRPNPEDARSKCVWITDAGRAFRDEAIGRLEPHLRRMAETISPAEIAAALPVLVATREYLDRTRGG